ncbi:MAG TPA: protein kinase [Kofleriaceae bacterium]|jgi:WD40 repeat protein
MVARAQLVGRQLGDFRLLEQIGHGGMGAAYRAEQVTLRRDAVVKTIAAEAVSDESKVRFLREARLASQLDHPYAAHVYAFGAESDGLLWIAMELVRGTPLDRYLADQGAMPLARFLPFFDRLCEVVYSAHEQGIVHRDIKPANVMVVRRAGRLLPKLLDFGIARGATLERDAPAESTKPAHAIVDAPLDDSGRSVTIRGHLVGSPSYMAPEQWVDAARATAQTDLYALAITAYELLAGRRPFDGKTVLEIARAHARTAVPPVGPSLPVALDHVFQRALAKRAADRYATVLELASAMREASRDSAHAQAIDLDEVVRDAFVQAGPQPLAEALLELAAARGPAAATEAAWRVVAVLVRAIGVVALAAHVRVGERKLDSKTRGLVQMLVGRGLDHEEWLALAEQLVAPFAERAQAHPVPELVEVMWAGSEPRRMFRELLALRSSREGADVEHVRALLAELGKVLRSCAFVEDYGWAAASTRGGESWTGPRRQPRDTCPVPADATPGSVWLVDRDNTPVLELSPFVRVAPPSPGADDELFVIDGPARRGARAVAWPREFEHYDEQLAKFVAQHLAPIAEVGTEHAEAAPYRGLASFGPADAAMFFGREREVEAVVNRLRVEPLIAVVGPSGVGKSSFVHAGVLPALPETWQVVSLRPGASPLAALESRLGSAGLAAVGLAERLRTDPSELAHVLDAAAHRQGARLVVVIDQLEEMFTQCRDAATRELFARALAALDGRAPVHVVLTLRDDFLVRAAELPGLGARLQAGLELVMLPDSAALRRTLVEPLRHVGYAFETEAMPDEMVGAVRDHPGALALLSFAASKLWELRDRKFRQLPRRAYSAIGGVTGALARHAEETLTSLPEADHALVRELFRHLVTSEGTRAMLLRDEAIQLLGRGAAAERVIETLVERRLVTGYEGDAKTERIEVVHEALLTAWPRLVDWQREDAANARLRDQVRSAARQWGERGRPKGLLWRGEALLELKLWRSRQGIVLTDLEHAFAEASIAEETRAQRIRRGIVATIIAGLVIGLVVLQRANAAAERNADAERRANLAMLVEQGRAQLIADHPQEAMVYLSEAYTRGARDPNLAFMLGVGKRALAGQLLTVDHGAIVKWAALSPDGMRLVTTGLDGKTRIWDAASGTLLRELSAGGKTFAEYPSFAGTGLLTWSPPDEVPTVWDLATGTKRFALPVPAGSPAEATSDGSTIVTLEAGMVRTWNAADGSPRGQRALPPGDELVLRLSGSSYMADVADGAAVGPIDLSAPPRVVPGAHYSWFGGAGKELATIDVAARKLRLWQVADPDKPVAFSDHTGETMMFAAFSPDGSKLVSALGDEHAARLWDVASLGSISLDGHAGYVLAVAWTDDGKTVATGSADRTVRLWDPQTGAPRRVLYGHTDVISSIHFDRSGRRMITGSYDGTARVFDTAADATPIDIGHQGAITLRLSADSRRALIVGHDGSLWLYDLHARTPLLALDTHSPPVAKFAADFARACGDIDATGDAVVVPAGNEAHVIRLADRAHPIVLGPHDAAVSCARFLPSGELVTATDSGRLAWWSATGRAEATLDLHTGRIVDLAIEPASGAMLVASNDGARLVAADHSFRVIQTRDNGVSGVAFSHDGTRMATSSDTVATVFDTTGRLVWATHAVSSIEAIAFDPSDRRIATANDEGTATVYASTDGSVLAKFGEQKSGAWATSVAFAADRRTLVVGNDHGELIAWPIDDETRDPAAVAADVRCEVPYTLEGTRLIAQATTRCGTR